MKLVTHTNQAASGAALIGAILVVGAASIGLGLWTTILSQRAASTEAARGGMMRQIAMFNSAQMLRSHLQSKVALSTGGMLDDGGTVPPSNEIRNTSGSSRGGVYMDTWAGQSMGSIDTWVKEFNPFSPAATEKPYAKVFSAQGVHPITKTYPADTFIENKKHNLLGSVQTRSPLLGAYQLVLHTPSYAAPYTVTGNIETSGLLAFPADVSYLAIKSPMRTFVNLPTTFTPASAGAAFLPSNLPTPALTSGSIGGAADFTGKLDVLTSSNGGNNIQDRLVHTGPAKVWRFDGNTNPGYPGLNIDTATGVMTVDLRDNQLDHLVVTNHISEIVFTGDGSNQANQRRTIGIVYLQNATTTKDLTKITFNGVNNGRRLLLALQKVPSAANTNGTNVNFAFTNSTDLPNWRFMGIFERTPVTVQATGGAGTITLKGGIQTNAALAFPVAPSRTVITKETEPLYLSRYTPRLAWVETINL